MADSLWLSGLLLVLLVRGVAPSVTPECESSHLVVDPCNQGQSVAVNVCVLVGTSLIIMCNVQDTTVAWISPDFDETALISSSIPMSTWLNDTVNLEYIDKTPTCVLSSATIHDAQLSMNGLDMFCWNNGLERNGANISIVVIDGTIASVKQMKVDLTTDEKHVDLEFIDDQQCQFDKYLISKGSCSQQNDSTTFVILEVPTLQGRIDVNSFSGLCVSACTEESVCTCQEIDLDNFTVEHSQELLEETTYFVLLSFSHDVLNESVGVSPTGSRANCKLNVQTSKRVMLSCTNLSNATTYSITVQGMARLNNSQSGYQYIKFNVSLIFSTAPHMNNATVDEEGLSGWAIAGIVLSIIVFIILVLTGIVVVILVVAKPGFITKYMKKEQTEEPNPNPTPAKVYDDLIEQLDYVQETLHKEKKKLKEKDEMLDKELFASAKVKENLEQKRLNSSK